MRIGSRSLALSAARVASLLLAATIVFTGPVPTRAEEKAKKPADALLNRSYCAVEAGPGRVAACATYGVVVYAMPDAMPEQQVGEIPLDMVDKKLLLPDSVNDLCHDDGLLYAANGPSGVKIISGVGGKALTLQGEIDTLGAAMAVTIVGKNLFVAMGVMGVGLYDVSDPSSPRLVQTLDTEGYARNLFAYAGAGRTTLIVANGRGGVAHFEFGPEMNLAGARKLECGEDVRQVVPFGQGFVLARGGGGVCYADASLDKESLVCIPSRDFVRTVAVDGPVVYAGDGGEGMMLIEWTDVSKPGNVRRIMLAHGSMNRISIIRGKVAVAADYAGIVLLDPVQSGKEQ